MLTTATYGAKIPKIQMIFLDWNFLWRNDLKLSMEYGWLEQTCEANALQLRQEDCGNKWLFSWKAFAAIIIYRTRERERVQGLIAEFNFLWKDRNYMATNLYLSAIAEPIFWMRREKKKIKLCLVVRHINVHGVQTHATEQYRENIIIFPEYEWTTNKENFEKFGTRRKWKRLSGWTSGNTKKIVHSLLKRMVKCAIKAFSLS